MWQPIVNIEVMWGKGQRVSSTFWSRSSSWWHCWQTSTLQPLSCDTFFPDNRFSHSDHVEQTWCDTNNLYRGLENHKKAWAIAQLLASFLLLLTWSRWLLSEVRNKKLSPVPPPLSFSSRSVRKETTNCSRTALTGTTHLPPAGFLVPAGLELLPAIQAGWSLLTASLGFSLLKMETFIDRVRFRICLEPIPPL